MQIKFTNLSNHYDRVGVHIVLFDPYGFVVQTETNKKQRQFYLLQTVPTRCNHTVLSQIVCGRLCSCKTTRWVHYFINCLFAVFLRFLCYILIIRIINDTERLNIRCLTISSLCHEMSTTRTLKCLYKAQSCANHVQHIPALIVCNMSFVMWCKETSQLSILTEFKSHLTVALFHWLKSKTDEGGEITGLPGENPRRRALENATC